MTNTPVIAKTLSEHLSRQLLVVGAACLVTALCLFLLFSWLAMELTSERLMQMEAESILRLKNSELNYQLPHTTSFSAYQTWLDIPTTERQLFAAQPDVNVIAEALRQTSAGLEYVYLLHHQNSDGESLWLLSRHSEQEVIGLIDFLLDVSMSYALWFALVILLLLFGVFYWLIRQTTQPLSILSDWAKKLAQNPEASVLPSFHIVELNQLAEQIKIGIDDIQYSNRREREFLQTASHELRTPLATIQASLDTLDLLADARHKPALSRAQKASHNMSQLTTTLLWLARKNGDRLKKQSFDIHALVAEQIEYHRYLADGKSLTIHFDAMPQTVLLEFDLVQVIVANLIRNALQYSSPGVIVVKLSTDGFVVHNPLEINTEETRAGFGLGIELVQRICVQQQWRFEFKKELGSVSAGFFWSIAIDS